MYPTATLADLLLLCLQKTPADNLAPRLAQLSRNQWQQLIALAGEQNVPSLFYHRLKTHGCEGTVPTDLWERLRKNYHAVAHNNLYLYRELAKVIAAFQQQNIPVIVLKGAQIAATVYETIALRSMVDIDILVPQSALISASEQLQALGYQPSAPLLSLDAYLLHRHHLPPFVHPKELAAIELHWTITPSHSSHAIPIQTLWERRLPVVLHGIATNGFCPEDLLLHVCMHATYHHWLRQGVRFLCDVAEIVDHYGQQLDWDSVIERAVAWRWQRGIFLALLATQQLLGAKIPDQVIHRLNFSGVSQFSTTAIQSLLFPEQREQFILPAGYFLDFFNTSSSLTKLRLLSGRVFLSPKEMAVKYPVSPHSLWYYYYYFVRLRDLMLRFAYKAWRAWRGDPTLTSMMEQQKQLQRWLEEAEDG